MKSHAILVVITLLAGCIIPDTYLSAETYYPNYVRRMADDGEYLWLATDCGLVRFDKATGARTYYTEANSDIPSDNLHSVALVNDEVWVGTNQNGIGIFNGASWDSLTESNSGLPSDLSIKGLLATDNDGVWIGGGFWVSRLHDNVWESYQIITNVLLNSYVNTIAQDESGRIWVGTNDKGVYHIQDGIISVYDEVSLPGAVEITAGPDSTIWICGSGFHAIRGDSVTTYPLEDDQSPGIIAFEGDSVQWLGLYDTIARIDGDTWEFYDAEDFAPLRRVLWLHYDEDGVVWAGTFENGLIRFDGENWSQYDIIPGVTGVEKEPAPEGFALLNAYPNPFNPSTTISFSLPEIMPVSLAVYDIIGRKVVTLVDGAMDAGTHSILFDGSRLASGVYFYRFDSPGFSDTGKMLLVK